MYCNSLSNLLYCISCPDVNYLSNYTIVLAVHISLILISPHVSSYRLVFPANSAINV